MRGELGDIDALWRWVRAQLREGLGARHHAAATPDLSAQLLERWREGLEDLVDVAGVARSLHPLDVDHVTRWVRESLRYQLGHRARRVDLAVTDLQADILAALLRATVLELADRYRARRGGRELLTVRLEHAWRTQHPTIQR